MQQTAYWLLSCVSSAVFWLLRGQVVHQQMLVYNLIPVATFALLVSLAVQRSGGNGTRWQMRALYFSLLPVLAITLGFVAITIYKYCSQDPTRDPLKHSITI